MRVTTQAMPNVVNTAMCVVLTSRLVVGQARMVTRVTGNTINVNQFHRELPLKPVQCSGTR